MIEFDHVTKVFPDGTRAVDDVSLIVPPRRTTVLVGTSGSGKTTLLRMVNRMVDPTGGQVRIDGVDVATRDVVELRRSIGYVLQNAGLMPHRTVVDNIATVPRLRGTPRREAHTRALELMDLVGLDRRLARRYPAQLSGGQQQRVGVARGLAADPNILLMDEPFGAVDPIVRADLQHELRGLQERLGKTIIFVTHDVDEAFTLGHQVVILRAGGTIAQRGTPAEIVASPADQFVADFIGLGRAQRQFRLEPTARGVMVIDGDDRPAGYLVGGTEAADGGGLRGSSP